MTKKLLTVTIMLLLSGSIARAGILIEPYFGYLLSGSNSAISGSTMSGSDIGGRVGWKILGFGLGIDATASGSYSYSNSLSYKPTHMGAFVSFDFPILVRGYAALMTSTKEAADNGSYYSGNGTKVGVQFTGLPFICVGLETFTTSVTNYTNAAGASTSKSDTETQTRLAVSIPLNF